MPKIAPTDVAKELSQGVVRPIYLLAGEEAFLQLAQADSTPMPLIRLTKGDLDERPRVICMAISDHQTV